MKHFKYIICIMLLGLFSCSSQKKLQTETPFELGSATCQAYIGGMENSGNGLSIKIPVTIDEASTLEMKEIYFRGKQASITMEQIDGANYAIAKIPNSKGGSAETIALALEATEAVLSYTENGKLKYTKVTGIKEKQPLLYKGKPKN
jgi:hypothetical protein